MNLLSTREKLALEELEQTQNSISYRFGRGVTWLPRKLIKIIKPKKNLSNINGKPLIYYTINTSLSAEIDLSLPTKRGITMLGNTTMSLKGNNGNEILLSM